jgi:hypothetical protein
MPSALGNSGSPSFTGFILRLRQSQPRRYSLPDYVPGRIPVTFVIPSWTGLICSKACLISTL